MGGYFWREAVPSPNYLVGLEAHVFAVLTALRALGLGRAGWLAEAWLEGEEPRPNPKIACAGAASASCASCRSGSIYFGVAGVAAVAAVAAVAGVAGVAAVAGVAVAAVAGVITFWLLAETRLLVAQWPYGMPQCY